MDIEALSDLAQQVSDIYADRFEIDRDAAWHMAKLGEEMGELQGAYLSLSGRGRVRDADLRLALENEVADVLGQLLLFARWQDIDVATAMTRKWGAHLPEAKDGSSGN